MTPRSPLTDAELRLLSNRYRQDILRYIVAAGAGHTGGSLSCVDILNVLYNRVLNVGPHNWHDRDRDRYVQSKGHSVESLYVVLAHVGFFPIEQLETLCHYASPYIGHPTRKVPGIEMNTGALGHGLPIAVGMALGAKRTGRPFRVVTLLGDGELAEGSNWEGAMAGSHYELDNLTAIIDRNGLQITGPTREVCSSEPLAEKFTSFGWHVREVDGHDLAALTDALNVPTQGLPRCVIANTVKGRGVSFMEHQLRWHHGVPTESEYETAMNELAAAAEVLQGEAL